MNKYKFDRLIDLYQKGLLKGRERKLVEDWLNKPGAEEDVPFSEEDKSLLRQKLLNRLHSTPQAELSPDLDLSGIRKNLIWGRLSVYHIAASLTLLALVAYFAISYKSSDSPVMQIASGSKGISKVILSDGTLVWLKGKSRLSYPSSFSGHTRKVSLQGEALFEVAKDAKHPFIVSAGKLTTTVLGTSFNIKATGAETEVVVLTGKVKLSAADNPKAILLLPNEKVIYDNTAEKIGEKRNSARHERLVAVHGTEYLMAFEDSRMDEVIRRIEQKFEVKINTDNAQLANCMITADFSDQSLENTISLISQVLGFTYSINGNIVSLRGKGCN